MKSNTFIQYSGNQISDENIRKKFKELWVSSGRKIKEIIELDIYFIVETNFAYCVVNKTEKLDFQL